MILLLVAYIVYSILKVEFEGIGMHIMMTTALICFILSTLYLVSLKSQFSEQLSIHQERSMQLYLDRQLIIKMIHNLTDNAGAQNIIHDITKYFTLEDVVILDPKRDSNDFINNYIQNNMQEIVENLSKSQFFRIQIDNTNAAKHLLIQYLDNKKKNWIVYVERTKHELSKNDIAVLTNAITPLLGIAYTNIENKDGV